MGNTAEMERNESKPPKKCGLGGWCVVFVRWVFILLFTVILLGGLYFKAPWKVLVLDAVLLALLTVVPKQKRKYGWLTLAAVVLAVTVWIFIPEKDCGDWRPYTFDEELAVLEAERAVPAKDNVAPLYEDLFQRWEQIKKDDPFPDEMDTGCGVKMQPWTAEEFPETAAWFGRHNDFFQDVIVVTQKPGCFFPASVTIPELSKSMDRSGHLRRFSKHLVRMSYLDLGDDRKDAWEKQIAVLSLGKHINQQPLIIDKLVGIATEATAYKMLTIILMHESFCENITVNDIATVKNTIHLSQVEYQGKWKQAIAYEKLFVKNFWGMFYEINPQGEIRFARQKNYFGVVRAASPDEKVRNLQNSYWAGVSWKISRVFMWAAGLPKDPAIISGWIDEAYLPLGNAESEGAYKNNVSSFELNYRSLIHQMYQMMLPSFSNIQETFNRSRTQMIGTGLICDLVLYENQHGQYPNTLDALWPSDEEQKVATKLYDGFVYEKTEDSFKLYHVGQNGIDENGFHEDDDILIWPEELEESD